MGMSIQREFLQENSEITNTGKQQINSSNKEIIKNENPEFDESDDLENLYLEEEELVTEKINRLKNAAYSFEEALNKNHCKVLILKNEKVFNLPENISQLKELERLDLADNKIKHLPNNIGELLYLEELYLQNNQLNSLPDTIQKLKNLRILSLKNNNLTSLPHDSINGLTNLEVINLSDNYLNDEDISQLKENFPNCNVLG